MSSNDTAIEYLRRCLAGADPATGHPLTGYERRLAEAELADRERHLERERQLARGEERPDECAEWGCHAPATTRDGGGARVCPLHVD